MKKRVFSRNVFHTALAVVGVASLLTFGSCDKDDDDDMPNSKYKLSGDASGAQEVPAVNTSGTGTLSGSYDTTSKSLIYTVTWTGISGDATVAHFHGPAAPGENAPPMQDLNITMNGTAGTATDTVTATADLHAALLAGKVYYNVHTADYPDGEIRGQVVLK
jgi:hypothetical protein